MDDTQNSIEDVIMQLDKKEISVLHIPEEYRDNAQIIQAESIRHIGVRHIGVRVPVLNCKRKMNRI